MQVAADAEGALSALVATPLSFVITRLNLADRSARVELEALRGAAPSAGFLVLTPEEGVPDAIELLSEVAAASSEVRGPLRYATPPFLLEEVLRWVEHLSGRDEAPAAEAPAPALERILGQSAAAVRLRRRIEVFAPTDYPVAITGEPGTQRHLAAQALHEGSPRRDRRLLALSLRSEQRAQHVLFGARSHPAEAAPPEASGPLAQVDGGSLYVEGLAELDPALQVRLARSLDPRTTGGAPFEGRLLSAMPPDIGERVTRGVFREDLYYLLDVLELELPPLRERRLDLPLLAETILRRLAPTGDRVAFTPRVLVALAQYPFPGNDRELEYVLERALMLAPAGQDIDAQHLPTIITSRLERGRERRSLLPLGEAVRNFERDHIVRALRTTGGHKRLAAELLGVSRKSLWKKLRSLGVAEREYRAAGAAHDEDDDDDAPPELDSPPTARQVGRAR